MSFVVDQKYAADISKEWGNYWGEYIVSYTSPNAQARAYLFREADGRVVAHVSFPPLVFASSVTDPYYTDLLRYAEEHGFADKFELMLS